MMKAGALLLAAPAWAAAPGITSNTGTAGNGSFTLTAQEAYLNQPDGNQVYSWGYGCLTATGITPSFKPTLGNQVCNTMQVPGPTLIVTENQTVTVNLTNNLPAPAGNTSILFPDFKVTATGGVAGLLTQEAKPGLTVTYTFTATTPGTHAYYSGTQGDLQIEMGLYGAIVVLPATVPAACNTGVHAANVTAQSAASLAHPLRRAHH
jgi:FtsP/CotA-like multicopper oxidase with cupredoxin domain